MLRVHRMTLAATAAVAVPLMASVALGAVPSRLHVIDVSAMSNDQLVMVQSLQGIVAGSAADRTPQIWISGETDPGLLDYLRSQFGISLTSEGDPFILLLQLLGQVKGYDQCDLTLRSLNVASPLAGVDGAVVASTPEIADTLSTVPLNLSLVTDVRQFTESYWLGTRFTQLNPSLLIEQTLLTGGPQHLRDLSAAQKVFTFTDAPLDSSSIRERAMALTTPHSCLLGFPQSPDEFSWIRAASTHQHAAVRADTAHNLSVLSGIGKGQTHSQRADAHTSKATTVDGSHYVCVVMDGGWDIGWTLNQFRKPNWFGNPRRGGFPMNWEISPALLDFAPPALAFLYSQASANDFFVAPPSGFGKLYPSKYPGLAGYVQLLGPKVKQSDLRVVNVMDDIGGVPADARAILDRPEVLGVFYKTNNALGDYYTGVTAGTFDVHSGKVIWPYRYALWNNGLAANTADAIATSILGDTHRSPRTDPLSYSLIAVFPFSFWDEDPEGTSIMDETARLVGQLRADPEVRIVSAEEFAWLLRANFGDGQSGVRFPDVPTTHWAWENVEAVAKAEIAQGFPDGLYHPGTAVDRGQMAVFVARAIAGGEASVPSGPAIPSFPDVPMTHFAYRHVEFCKSQQVVTGFPGGLYHPELLVNRAQMAVFVARAMVAPGGDAAIPTPEPPARFPDVSSTNEWGWAFPQVEFAADREVVLGFPDGLYHPESSVTRDQMAVFIGRAFALM